MCNFITIKYFIKNLQNFSFTITNKYQIIIININNQLFELY